MTRTQPTAVTDAKLKPKRSPQNNNKNTKFLWESLVYMFDKCSPAALQSRPAPCWRLQQRRFAALLLLGCKFSGWLLSLRIDPLRHLEPRYWHMGRRWAGKSGNLPTLNYDIHRWCHNRGTGLSGTHAVRRGIESICLSFVLQNTHSNTHQAKAFHPKQHLMAPCVLLCVSVHT